MLFLASWLRCSAAFILDCLFPKECQQCGREGAYLCGPCRSGFRPSYPQACFGCGLSRRQGLRGRLCPDCQPRFAFDGIAIAADYEHELVKRFIRAYKYRFVQELADELGRILNNELQAFLAEEVGDALIGRAFFQATVVPVPLSGRRRKWRGFNQAQLLAQRLAEFAGLALDPQLLVRKHRPAQATLAESARRQNLAGTVQTQKTAPPLVILVDDVATTGATLNECARALKRAGAEEVWCFVVAKG